MWPANCRHPSTVKQQKKVVAFSFSDHDASELKCSLNSTREHSWHKLANHVLTTIGLPHRSQYSIFFGIAFSSIILSHTPLHMKYTRFKASVLHLFFLATLVRYRSQLSSLHHVNQQ